MTKRTVAMLLAGAMALCLCACGEKDEDVTTTKTAAPTLTPTEESGQYIAVGEYDFDHNGAQETVERIDGEHQWETLALRVVDHSGTSVWEADDYAVHSALDTYFAYQVDGKDYLLCSHFNMSQGKTSHSYTVFDLVDGQENVLAEDSVTYDVNWDDPQHQFDPQAIASYVEGERQYFEDAVVLMNMDEAEAQRVPERTKWLWDDCGVAYDEEKTLEENLQILKIGTLKQQGNKLLQFAA